MRYIIETKKYLLENYYYYHCSRCDRIQGKINLLCYTCACLPVHSCVYGCVLFRLTLCMRVCLLNCIYVYICLFVFVIALVEIL